MNFRGATIGTVDLGTAVVTLIVAAIGVAAGFIGGYLSARWQARNDLAQWRRDRLLQYCADLVAAGVQLSEYEDKEFPHEASTRLQHAKACVFMLSEELSDPAQGYLIATLELLREKFRVPEDKKRHDAATKKYGKAEGRFLRDAHDYLRDLAMNPPAWSKVWTRVRTAVQNGMGTSVMRQPAPVQGHATESVSTDGRDMPRDSPGSH